MAGRDPPGAAGGRAARASGWGPRARGFAPSAAPKPIRRFDDRLDRVGDGLLARCRTVDVRVDRVRELPVPRGDALWESRLRARTEQTEEPATLSHLAAG